MVGLSKALISHAHTCTFAHAQVHTYSHTHTCTHPHILSMYTQAHAYKDARAHTRTHSHTNARTHLERREGLLLIPTTDSLHSCWQNCKLSEDGSKRTSSPPPSQYCNNQDSTLHKVHSYTSVLVFGGLYSFTSRVV